MASIGRNIILFIFISIFTPSTFIAQSEWVEKSFEDFRDGSFTDAGSNAYISAKGRMQIITKWDFNNDSFLDIFLPGSQTHTEKENIFIYLNNGHDIDASSRIELPAAGASDGLIADFNKDGYNELAVVHYSDSHFKRVPAWIYIGSDNGYTVENRIELPSASGSAIAAGDFNNDSWLDVVVACQYWYESEDLNVEPRKSFIYWNSPNGFDPENRMPITIEKNGITKLAVGDLDSDTIDDLVAITRDNTYLFLSSKNAFNNIENIIPLDIKSKAAAIGDIDNDGFPDLALCTSSNVVLIKGIYKNNTLASNQLSLPVSNPEDVELRDINLDGKDDVVVANLSTRGGATWTDSYVFISDGNNFTTEKTISLPTLGATSVSTEDLNGDGYPTELNQRKYRTIVVFSGDKGRIWGNHVLVAYDKMLGRGIPANHSLVGKSIPVERASATAIVPAITQEGFREADIVEAPNGDLVCMMRSGGRNGESVNLFPTPLYCSRLSDQGRTWSPPEQVADRGVCPNLVTMSNGIIVCSYSRPGNWLIFSEDNGQTWSDGLQLGDTRNYCYVVETAPDTIQVYHEVNEEGGKVVYGTFFRVSNKEN